MHRALLISIVIVIVIMMVLKQYKCSCGCYSWCKCNSLQLDGHCCCSEKFLANNTRYILLITDNSIQSTRILPLWEELKPVLISYSYNVSEKKSDDLKNFGPVILMLDERGKMSQYSGILDIYDIARWATSIVPS